MQAKAREQAAEILATVKADGAEGLKQIAVRFQGGKVARLG